jgi:mannose-6-phosphate isomerase-like protein (cupin superfamily)
VVVEGIAEVVCGNETKILRANESTYIPKGTIHRLSNAGKTNLKIIEIQTGDYLEEDDIERIEDEYDR